jgi:D-alanyl-D-alanine carboxypeptidase
MERSTSSFLRIPVCLTLFVIALTWAGPTAAKYAALVMDAHTGKVHHTVNADTRNYPASLTKLMTLYLLFEKLDAKEITLATRFTVSRRAARQPASRLGLRRGQNITVGEAIPALIIKSANDVAVTVAEALAGSERKFALHMTAKARKLGMKHTIFRNASGLPHRGQFSTAGDMAILAKALIVGFSHHYHFFAQRSFQFRGRAYRTHNDLLKTYDGTDGMKTGYIRVSGYNLVASVKRGERRLIGVIFGGNSAKSRDRNMKKLLDQAFDGLGHREERLAAARPRKAARRADIRWAIQVGAYYSRAPAFDAARNVKRRLETILARGRITIMPLKRSRNRILYRARIVGLDRRSAVSACRLLKRERKPCLPMRVPSGFEVAVAK